jgi:two-component sensor histidine kinase
MKLVRCRVMENLILAIIPRTRFPVAIRYLATLAIIGVAFLLRLSLGQQLEHYPVLLFIPAVFLSALLFDKGSGFFATVVSAVVATYYFIPPAHSFAIEFRELVPILLFVAIGFTISAVTEALRQTIKKLADAEQAKTLLLKEQAHRTKNDLMMVASVLMLQARGQTDTNIRAALESAIARVQVIAKAQDRLNAAHDSGTVELSGYVQAICSGLGDLLRDIRPIAVRVRSAPIELSSSKAVSIGLIVNELVTNAFKYAFPDNRGGAVDVEMEVADNSIVLSVTDDGIGCAVEPVEGVGSRLVRLMATQMGGDVRRVPVPNGCRVIVSVPVEEKRD